MSIEQILSDVVASNAELKASIDANTAALKEILSAGSVTETPKPAAAPAKKQAKVKAADPGTKPEPTPEPEPAAEETPEPEPTEEGITEETVPTKVAATEPAAEEFSDPLDKDTVVVVKGDPAPKIDFDKVKNEIIEHFKAEMTKGDAARKQALKDAFPVVRAKQGLGPDDKLDALRGTPEKLVALLADIKAL